MGTKLGEVVTDLVWLTMHCPLIIRDQHEATLQIEKNLIFHKTCGH